MEIQNKPDYLLFANDAKTGELEAFPDVSRGWGVTIEQTQSKPPMEWMNGAFNRVDANTLYILQQGIPEWSEKVLYPANAVIKVDDVIYVAKSENTNLAPNNNANIWGKLIDQASTTKAGIVKLSSALNSDSEKTAATSKSVKELNENKLSVTDGSVNGDINFTGKLQQNGNDVITTETISDYQNELGVNQKWIDLTADRSFGVTYTNTTNDPIMVSLSQGSSVNKTTMDCYVDNVLVMSLRTQPKTSRNSACFVVPSKSYYAITAEGSDSIGAWAELR